MLKPGQVLVDGLVVVAPLRRGRRLDVYDVWSDARHSRCIAKSVRPERLDDDNAKDRLIREAKILSTLGHPHLLRCYELVDGGAAFGPIAVFETLSGADLDFLISRRRSIPIRQVALMGVQLCSALRYLHSAGWLHLDVKPSNVIAHQGRAILFDLSLALPIGSMGHGGTFDYMSPEQAGGQVVTEASDVWGLGATLYAALDGRSPYGEWPYDTDTDHEPEYPQLLGAPVPLRRRLPRPFGELINSCLSPHPRDRPNLGQVSERLERLARIDPRRFNRRPG